MTTEIAVLNRLGVALATDSTVTVTGINNSKTFDSADKLFELHCRHPVGIMINGSLDFFGVPWELLIKDFRAEYENAPHVSISDWAKNFLNYLESRSYFDVETEKNYIQYVTLNELSFLKSKASNRLWSDPKNLTAPIENVLPFLIEEIEARNKAFDENYSVAFSLEGTSADHLADLYRDFIVELVTKEMLPVATSAQLSETLLGLICKAARLTITGDISTGLIFSGFGTNDLYPSVYSIEIDGYLDKKIKHSEIEEVARIDNPVFGFAKSFAQDEVIERLLDGVDDNFVFQTTDFLNHSASKLTDAIYDDLKEHLSISEEVCRGRVQKLLDVLPETFLEEIAPEFRLDFRQDFERMIAMMPKMELIEFAEALISIAAIERKASGGDRSVGGPVDVAFITKHEGFVWIKRKLYFDRDLNPRYFWRKYKEQ